MPILPEHPETKEALKLLASMQNAGAATTAGSES